MEENTAERDGKVQSWTEMGKKVQDRVVWCGAVLSAVYKLKAKKEEEEAAAADLTQITQTMAAGCRILSYYSTTHTVTDRL